MMIRKTTLLTALALIALPSTALAYVTPEDVLLNRELFLPPSAREAQDRNHLQAEESAARREREQERAFELQQPAIEEIDEPLQAAAPAEPAMPALPAGYVAVPVNNLYGQALFGAAPTQTPTLDAANLELQRTMRLLGRVNQNQAINQFQAQILHSSADDLAPTGAGTVLAIMVLAVTAFFIVRSSRKEEALIQA